ncbi:MAG: hypothetical protein Ta2A_03320 [Treponemataceae bacterium]|nr:MAG: hypothetical protein Ta2A_03320 [Treponemataceae bacterium]
MLASSDVSLIATVRKHIPIWNINSFAEYALQIIGKYKKEYVSACAQIAAERARFKELLEKSGMFTVYPSQANYFLCRILGKNADAAQFAEALLEKNIFIKDLTGKKGIPDNSFIRLAIRNAHDNDVLLEEVTKAAIVSESGASFTTVPSIQLS